MSTKLNLGAACALLISGPAFAQAPGNAIDDRARQQVRVPSQEELEEAILSGDTDIVLTRRTRLFTLHANVEGAYTDNAYLSDRASKVEDGYVQAQAGIGAGTRIGGKVDVFADASILSVRYLDQSALDYAALSGVVGARAAAGPVFFTATYQPTIVFDRGFSRRQLTSHRLRLTASLPFAAGPVLLEPALSAERTLSNPADYEAWSGGGSITASMPLSNRVPVVAYGSAEYQRREFDSYFPGLVGVERKDDALSVNVGVAWRPARWGEVRASYSFQRNWSTSDVNRYEAHGGRFGVSGVLRF